MPYYHYTDMLDEIIASGELWGSVGPGDAAFGEGVYFTGLPPSKGQKQIVYNNWRGIWENHADAGKMSGVIDFEAVGDADDRDVILYNRSILTLSDYSWGAFDIRWKGQFLRKLVRRETSDLGDGDEDADEDAEY